MLQCTELILKVNVVLKKEENWRKINNKFVKCKEIDYISDEITLQVLLNLGTAVCNVYCL